MSSAPKLSLMQEDIKDLKRGLRKSGNRTPTLAAGLWLTAWTRERNFYRPLPPEPLSF